MKHLAIALALGDIYDKKGEGPQILPPDGSIHRFKSVTKALPQDKSTLIVCSAGFSSGYPRQLPVESAHGHSPPRVMRLKNFIDRYIRGKKLPIPYPDRNVSLADQLLRYVREEEPHLLKYVKAQPMCWSTRNEIRMGIKLALRTGFAQRGSDVLMSIASNRTHLLRIWIYVHLYTPYNWKVELIRAKHHFSLWSHLLEIPKTGRDLLYAYRVIRRLERIKAIRRTRLES